tara:strand:+ start:647 stop:820 length:174 start_codon:yes stop_codon:yes gene_type:complete
MIFKLEKLNTKDNAGFRIKLFKYISITFLISSLEGTHFTVAFGIYPAETSLQLSLWD